MALPDDLAALDCIFELSDGVTSDAGQRQMYEILVARLQREARHLQMNTVMQLLIERIATNYVVIKVKEAVGIGREGGFTSTSAQEKFNAFWLSMVREFNGQLKEASRNQREIFLAEVLENIRTVLLSEDVATRERLLNRFSDQFEAAQL